MPRAMSEPKMCGAASHHEALKALLLLLLQHCRYLCVWRAVPHRCCRTKSAATQLHLDLTLDTSILRLPPSPRGFVLGL